MIENVMLSTDIQPVYTSPGTPGDVNVQTAITTIIFCNVTDPDDSTVAITTGAAGNDTNVDVYLVKSGQTADPSINMIMKQVRLPAAETLFFDTERVVLGAGDSIQARASENNKVIVTVSVLPV
jgi:hypothetical protein